MGNYFEVEYYTSLEHYNEAWSPSTSISYSRNGFNNTNLGRYRPWSGSKKDLSLIIKNLIDKNLFYADYAMIGHLSLILSECPYDYDFIMIK